LDNEDKFYELLNDFDYHDFDKLQNLDQISDEEKEIRVKIKLANSIKFDYAADIARFITTFDDERIDFIDLSEQICYVLGYEVEKPVKYLDIARYSCDLKGGVSFLCCYSDIIEELPFGDALSSLLQIIAVSGKPGIY
jgi:hypothetical protein